MDHDRLMASFSEGARDMLRKANFIFDDQNFHSSGVGAPPSENAPDVTVASRASHKVRIAVADD